MIRELPGFGRTLEWISLTEEPPGQVMSVLEWPTGRLLYACFVENLSADCYVWHTSKERADAWAQREVA